MVTKSRADSRVEAKVAFTSLQSYSFRDSCKWRWRLQGSHNRYERGRTILDKPGSCYSWLQLRRCSFMLWFQVFPASRSCILFFLLFLLTLVLVFSSFIFLNTKAADLLSLANKAAFLAAFFRMRASTLSLLKSGYVFSLSFPFCCTLYRILAEVRAALGAGK